MNETYRITLHYTSSDCAVKSVNRLAMRVPSGGHYGDAKPQQEVGQFVEIRGPKDRLLYRRFLNEIIPKSIGIPTGDADKPYAQAPIGNYKGIASVLVPVIDKAQRIIVLEATAQAQQKQKGKSASSKIDIKELIEVKLDDVKEKK